MIDDDMGRALTVRPIHQHLWKLTGAPGEADWQGRLLVLQALRRALLRDAILLRLLPDRTALAEAHWGELLVKHLLRSPSRPE